MESTIWRGPASEDSIQALIRAVSMPLPEAYIEFLRRHNGGEGAVVIEPGWISLWPAEEVVELNAQYDVAEYFPGYFVFGSDGGGEMLAFEMQDGSDCKVVMLPFIGDVSDRIVIAASFEAFLNSIRSTRPGES